MWLIVLSCKTIFDVQATISLTNDRFDGNRHRPLYPYRGSNVYVSLCHDEILHYLSFPVLCAQGLSLHCRTLLKFMNVPTRREHTKVQESAPFASEPVLFVSGNTLSVNIGYVCRSLSHPTKKYFLPLSSFWDGRDQGTSSTAQKEVAMPTSFIENKVWVGVLSLTGSKTSFWAMDSSHFREDTAARKLDRGLDI